MRKIRLSEQQLINLIKRVIKEQSSFDWETKGYLDSTIPGKLYKSITKLENHYGFGESGEIKYYINGNKDIKLLFDGESIYFVTPPKGIDTNVMYKENVIGPFKLSDVESML